MPIMYVSVPKGLKFPVKIVKFYFDRGSVLRKGDKIASVKEKGKEKYVDLFSPVNGTVMALTALPHGEIRPRAAQLFAIKTMAVRISSNPLIEARLDPKVENSRATQEEKESKTASRQKPSSKKQASARSRIQSERRKTVFKSPMRRLVLIISAVTALGGLAIVPLNWSPRPSVQLNSLDDAREFFNTHKTIRLSHPFESITVDRVKMFWGPEGTGRYPTYSVQANYTMIYKGDTWHPLDWRYEALASAQTAAESAVAMERRFSAARAWPIPSADFITGFKPGQKLRENQIIEFSMYDCTHRPRTVGEAYTQFFDFLFGPKTFCINFR